MLHQETFYKVAAAADVLRRFLVPALAAAGSVDASSVAATLAAAIMMISMDVPARILAYFAACEEPIEYTGWV